MWAISPDSVERLEKMRTDEELKIPLLLDPELEATKALGLVNGKGDLPHPTTLIVEPDGVISYLRIDEGVVTRPSNDEVLDALRASAKK